MNYNIWKIRIKQKLVLLISLIIMVSLNYYNRSINASKSVTILGLFVPLSIGIIYNGIAVYIMKVNIKRYGTGNKITEGALAQKTGLVIVGFGLFILLVSLAIAFLVF